MSFIAILVVSLLSEDNFYICSDATRAVSEIGHKFGERWIVTGDLTRNALVLYPGDDSAEDARANLANVLSGTWVFQGGQWLLSRTPEQSQKLLEDDRIAIKASIAAAQKNWKETALKSETTVSDFLRTIENLANQAARGDKNADDGMESAFYSNAAISSFAYKVLASLPAELLATASASNPVTFSTSPRGKQHKLGTAVLNDFREYQDQYIKAIAASLQRSPHYHNDPRSRIDSQAGLADRVLAVASVSALGVLQIRVLFVDKDGWVIASTGQLVRPPVEEMVLTPLNGLVVDVPDRAKEFFAVFSRPSDVELKPTDNMLLNTQRVDPMEWLNGSYLLEMAKTRKRKLYAVIPDYIGYNYVLNPPTAKQTATSIFRSMFKSHPVTLTEEDDTWFISPKRPLLAETIFLDRKPFAKYVDELNRDGYIRPHAIARYTVAQDSLLCLDSWDRILMSPSTRDGQDVFAPFYKLGYLAWGSALAGRLEARGRVEVNAMTVGQRVWREINNCLNDSMGLMLAFPESRTSDGRQKVEGVVLSETFPNGIPDTLSVWASVVQEDCLAMRADYGQYGVAWNLIAKRSSSIYDFLHERYQYCVVPSEVLVYGVKGSDSGENALVFTQMPKKSDFKKYLELSKDWQNWMKLQDEEYQLKYPARPTVEPPPHQSKLFVTLSK